MRLSPLSAAIIIAAVVGIRIGVLPSLGVETYFQRGLEACSGLGLLLAALSFERGDPPLRPWALLAGALLLVPLARAALASEVVLADAKLGHLLLILSNFLSIAALLAFRRVLLSTGLTPEWTPGARKGALAIGGLLVAACLALMGFTLSETDLAHLSPPALIALGVTIISIIADTIMCGIGILLVRLVAPMMGGSVALPYVLVALGGGVFLLVDLFSVLQQVTTQDQFHAPIPIALATIGWAAFTLAGLSQRGIVRGG